MVVVRDSLVQQVAAFDRIIRRLAKGDDTSRRLMSVPGVGIVVSLAFRCIIDDPQRFARARNVGAHLGLIPKHYLSGELDLSRRISKCGDGFMRTCLYEAPGVLPIKVQRWSPLKAWGVRLMKRVGVKKAKVVVARKLAIILSRI
jgi:transposase